MSARDRDGNMGDEAKLIADECNVVTDKELREYESHGTTMRVPTGQAMVTRKRYPSKSSGGSASAKPASAPRPAAAATARPARSVDVPVETLKTMYVRIQNPNDHEQLLSLKKICGLYPGQNSIVMMLGDNKSNAIRLPFRVDVQASDLTTQLTALLGDESVVVK